MPPAAPRQTYTYSTLPAIVRHRRQFMDVKDYAAPILFPDNNSDEKSPIIVIVSEQRMHQRYVTIIVETRED